MASFLSCGPLEQPSPTDQPAPEAAAALAAARQELEQGLAQLAELDQLIVDLPGIFERKFAQRLQPLLESQRLLSEDNHALREHLQLALPQGREGQARLDQRPGVPAGSDQAPASQNPANGQPVWRRRLHQATRRLLRLGP